MSETTMNTYLIQLTEQMRESARNLPDPNVVSEFDEESLPEELKPFAYAERFIHGKAKKISFITGIDTIAFPPPDKLTDVQITFLYDEMKRLLNAFCFYTDFPEGLPVEIKYSLLRKKWDDKAVYTGEGMTVFEFCDYETDRCPFPEEFCSCKDYDFDDDELDMDNTDNPEAEPF
ncbi:MAG: hypothetical protein EA359_19030 [Balneolaceae bacterium]|nr:MAG: hypothetical protein EA359_19030 [Balneolaceae bacterium]